MSGNRLVETVSLRKQRRHTRILRVGLHDTRALIHEFRKPLVVFLLAIFAGGYIYRQLNNNFSDNEQLKLVDMPHYMLALMVLESSIKVPDEPYLIVFWYAMPLVAVYIVGRGAADFFRLFINREQRRSAWEVAMRVRDMNPDVRIVARMWDDRLARQIENFLNVEVLSASDLAAPAFAGAAVGAEITQNLHIAGLEYSMIRLVLRRGSFMDGRSVDEIQEREGVDIVLLHRRDDGSPDVHPSGDIIVRGGDTIVLFSHHDLITEIIGRNETGRS